MLFDQPQDRCRYLTAAHYEVRWQWSQFHLTKGHSRSLLHSDPADTKTDIGQITLDIGNVCAAVTQDLVSTNQKFGSSIPTSPSLHAIYLGQDTFLYDKAYSSSSCESSTIS